MTKSYHSYFRMLRGIILYIVLALFIVTLTVPLSAMIDDMVFHVRLDLEGVDTAGEVTDRYVDRGYILDVRFNTNNSSPPIWHNNIRSISATLYDETQVGDDITVTFLPNAPNINRIEKSDQLLGQVVIVSVSAPIILLLIYLLRPRERRRPA